MNNRRDRPEEPTVARSAPPTPQEAIPEGILDLDHVYDALAHPRRRYLCYSLLERERWSLADLATGTVAWERDVPEAAVDDDERERAYVSLYHAHVPKLVDLDVLAFDRPTETVSAARNAEPVLDALEGIGAVLDDYRDAHERSPLDDGT